MPIIGSLCFVPAEEAYSEMLKAEEGIDGEEADFLMCDVKEQFSLFDLIEKYMESPKHIHEQCPIQLHPRLAYQLTQK